MALEFPLQAILAQLFASLRADQSIIDFLLFRHQPLIVLSMCILLIPWFKSYHDRFGARVIAENSAVMPG